MIIDLVFPVRGQTLPIDHAYLLFAALSHAIPEFHREDGGLRFSPINGEPVHPGVMRLFQPTPVRKEFCSRLRVRSASEQIGTVLPLAGKTLRVGDHTLSLGVPTVEQLTPAASLQAQIVLFKDFPKPCQRSLRRNLDLSARAAMSEDEEPGLFLQAAAQRLKEMQVGAEPGIPYGEKGQHAGKPRRRIVHIKGKKIVGYPLLVQGLTAQESIRLQEQGLGGRTRIGCGFLCRSGRNRNDTPGEEAFSRIASATT